MALTVRATSILTGDNNSFTVLATDTLIVIGQTQDGAAAPTLTFGGVACTLAKHLDGGGSQASLFYLNLPPVGAGVADSSATPAVQCAFFCKGATVTSVRDSDGAGTASNDVLAVPTMDSSVDDYVFYMGSKSTASPAWTGEDVETARIGTPAAMGAYEVGAATVTATWGQVGVDSSMVCIGVSFVLAAATRGGASSVFYMFRRYQKFLRDLKRGLIPSWDLQRRYREAYAI